MGGKRLVPSRYPPAVACALALLLLGSWQDSTASHLFTASFRSFDTGGAPSSLAIGDLNGDGHPDLATANNGSNTLSVLLANGDGTFQSRTDYAAGTNPSCVAIGDLNGDGHLDLTVTNKGSNTVSVFLGNGDGTVRPRVDYATGTQPSAVAIGDLNADGRPDLALANSGSNTVSVLLGNGNVDGTFVAGGEFPTGSALASIAIGDLNGDGRLDLVLACGQYGSVVVLLGNGDGTFMPKLGVDAGANPVSVAIGDLNGDGRPDLAVANSTGTGLGVSVLLGIGDGTFGGRAALDGFLGASAIAIADLNGDGHLDLAVAHLGVNSDNFSAVAVLLGDGSGTFGSRTNFVTGGYPTSLAIADLDGDHRLDLAVAHTQFAGGVAVSLGNGDGTFGSGAQFQTSGGPRSIAIGDLNLDGRFDLAVATGPGWPSGGNVVSVLLGNGDGTFGPSVDFGTNIFYPVSVLIGDLNNDGFPDLAVVGNPQSGLVSVLLGNGDGTFGRQTDTGARGQSIAIGDLNGDGKLDLVAAPDGPRSISVLLGNGDGTFGPRTQFGTADNPLSVATGDLNGDGRQDLVVAGSRLGSVLLGNGDGTFGPKTDFVAVEGPVAIADLNADGNLDVVMPGVVLLGNGDGTFGPRMEFAVVGDARSLAVGDLNGDRLPDLAVANFSSNTVSILPGSGYGTFWPKSDYGTGSHPVSVAIADLNGDGWSDVVVGNHSSYAVSVLLSNPTAVDADFGRPRLGLFARGYPNPAYGALTIEFAAPMAGEGSLRIYDVSGRKVASLLEGRIREGVHLVRWDLGASQRERVPAGVYFCELRAAGARLTNRLVVLPH